MTLINKLSSNLFYYFSQNIFVYLQVFTMEDRSQGDKPDCNSNPCLDGATCEDHDGTFTCFCTENRSGGLGPLNIWN